MPVRRGDPTGVGGLDEAVRKPRFATGVGLVLFGAQAAQRPRFKIRDERVYDKITTRMKEWFSQIL
jgi:cell division protein FtsA